MPEPRHARARARKPLRPVAATGGAAAGVMALGGLYIALAGGSSPAAVADDLGARHFTVIQVPAARHYPAAPVLARLASVTVRPGDTLSRVAVRLCGTAADTLALAYNNRLSSPDQITPGQVLQARCTAPAAAVAAAYPPPKPVPPTTVAAPAVRSSGTAAPVERSPAGGFTCSGLEALWDQAGGNPGAAFTAAEIAMAESGGNPDAVSPTDDLGLWQINSSNGTLATLNPAGNARSAVILSHDGADWSPWTTYTSGAYAGRC